MPTYVYKCAHCGHIFEARQRMSENPLTDCPSCEASALRRVINNVGIVFRGNGFYVTDNRNGRNGSASPSNGSGAKDAVSKSDSGSDIKSTSESAGKAETKTESN